VTVTRLGEERFRVVTGAGVVDADRGWLVKVADEAGLARVTLADESDAHAVIGLFGPHARDVLQAVTEHDVSRAALPFRRAATVAIGGAPVLAQRISYVGELGFELYVPPEWAAAVWRALAAAGAPHGIAPVGYRALEGLRMEKGFRYMGGDLTPGDTPDEAGLAFCVPEAKTGYVGAEAIAAQRTRGLTRRIRTILVGDTGYATVYGGEAVVRDGEVVGRLRSCAPGFTVGRMLAYAYLPPELETGSAVEVEVLGSRVAGELADDCLYDPEHLRMLA
jgi:4-methylaminobutanoate oxidase (formaldehyde-forming)